MVGGCSGDMAGIDHWRGVSAQTKCGCQLEVISAGFKNNLASTCSERRAGVGLAFGQPSLAHYQFCRRRLGRRPAGSHSVCVCLMCVRACALICLSSVHTCMCIHVCMWVCVYVCVCTCLSYVYIYIYIYICIYIYIYMRTSLYISK